MVNRTKFEIVAEEVTKYQLNFQYSRLLTLGSEGKEHKKLNIMFLEGVEQIQPFIHFL